jgi:hypothetical protein
MTADNPYLTGIFGPVDVETTAFNLPASDRKPLPLIFGRVLRRCRALAHPVWPLGAS